MKPLPLLTMEPTSAFETVAPVSGLMPTFWPSTRPSTPRPISAPKPSTGSVSPPSPAATALETGWSERAARLAEQSDRPADAQGVALVPIERTVDAAGYHYAYVDAQLDEDARTVTLDYWLAGKPETAKKITKSRPRVYPAGTQPMKFAVGLLDMGGLLLFAYATSFGALGLAVVLSSIYPVVTIGLARVRLKERLAPVQQIGAALAIAGMIAVVAG